MKKIGIMTYHNHSNYGTMLQAYALQNKIEQLGYDAEIINFREDTSIKGFNLLLLRLRRLGVYIKEHKKYKTLWDNQKRMIERDNEFSKFYKKYIKVKGEMFTNTEEICANPPLYDGYVVGSDQTWSPIAAGGPEAFFLPFVTESNKKGSYAPSIGVSELTDEQEKKYKSLLKDFLFLSCREKTGALLLSKLLNRKVEAVLDPTFLLDSNDWGEVAEDIDRGEYIFTYFLGEKEEHRKYVKELSKKLNLKVVNIPIAYIEMADTEGENVWCGPEKFLGLLKNASIVCTDSFHGVALSINFGKDFYAFCKRDITDKQSDNSRITNILEMFGLSERLIGMNYNSNQEINHIEYDRVNEVLDEKRKESLAYLKNMLMRITE